MLTPPSVRPLGAFGCSESAVPPTAQSDSPTIQASVGSEVVHSASAGSPDICLYYNVVLRDNSRALTEDSTALALDPQQRRHTQGAGPGRTNPRPVSGCARPLGGGSQA